MPAHQASDLPRRRASPPERFTNKLAGRRHLANEDRRFCSHILRYPRLSTMTLRRLGRKVSICRTYPHRSTTNFSTPSARYSTWKIVALWPQASWRWISVSVPRVVPIMVFLWLMERQARFWQPLCGITRAIWCFPTADPT